MTYKGIVKGKTIEFEDLIELPEGTEVEVVVHIRPGKALAASGDPKGSGPALRRLWDTPSLCTPEDVETLLQAIDQGKRPVRFAGIFDQEDKPQEGPLLFPTLPKKLSDLCIRYAKKAGLKDVAFHCLRDTFISRIAPIMGCPP